MARKTLIAGNWKMNMTAADATALVTDLAAYADQMGNVDVLVCPTFTSIAAAVVAAEGTPVKVGAQNIHWAESGAFTGEISGAMLKEAGVSAVVIGHSERRQYFGETDETVNSRTKAALAADLMPVVCIGETLEEREDGIMKPVIETQIRKGLKGITADEMAKIVLAYEPVWAIGTGVTASPEQAQEVHAFIRELLVDMYGDLADSIRILYGGSMKAANAEELIGQTDIDGGLIGGASLKAEDFMGIIKVG